MNSLVLPNLCLQKKVLDAERYLRVQRTHQLLESNVRVRATVILE
jgi:hypothetical protein